MKTKTRWTLSIASLLILTAGIAQAQPIDIETAKGTGPQQSFSGSYETVWNGIHPILQSLDITVTGEDAKEGYILATAPGQSGDSLVVFVTKVDGANTKVEVASIKVPAITKDREDWRNIILNKLRASLPVPAAN